MKKFLEVFTGLSFGLKLMLAFVLLLILAITSNIILYRKFDSASISNQIVKEEFPFLLALSKIQTFRTNLICLITKTRFISGRTASLYADKIQYPNHFI